ncbi:MAG: HD-like signal output (HDOD) protein [Sulfurimonas sp.]|jgi:HD-like signal output (HDOD) protein|uniref:HDOD domain-containing protein n=1 Tax=Sulfurimonas sp. TaxID=2022749 RepID=UPI0039E724BA
MSYIPLIARIDSLPPLPESVLKIEELFQNEYPDIDALVDIITKDPSLTTDILSKVNAPFYGFSKTIISVLQATTLFGAPQIRALVLASSIQRSFDVNLTPYNISTEMFAKISITQSELLFQWYMNIDIDLARTLTPIAFLMETGKILIAKEVLQEGKEDNFKSDMSHYENISDVETMYTMMNTSQINSLIFKHLHLNDSFWESMKYLDNEQEIPDAMKDTVTILQIIRAAINVQDQLSEYSLSNAFKLLEESNYNIDIFKRAAKRVQTKYYT